MFLVMLRISKWIENEKNYMREKKKKEEEEEEESREDDVFYHANI